ncbi:MAG: zinc ribbon domain-containing protein [Betaproteobacteria bacterium]
MMLALAMLLLSTQALAQAGGAPKGNPRLASLNIEVWPEYDRPAALVILRGALAEDVKLPATVTLRVPAASGGAAAVAYSATADGNLLNLQHERASAGEFITLKFEAPQRFFHVEFYEPIATTDPARSFRYVWPGDLAVERVTVVVQEPASATAISVDPNLDGVSTGQDGLRYRAAELGALEAGKPLPIVVRYTKDDPRPSAQILKPSTGDQAFAAAPPKSAPAPVPATTASGGLPDWVFPLAGFAMLSVLGGAIILWQWRRHGSPSAAPAGYACTKCGAQQAPGNRFCSSCGAKIA